MFYVAHFNDHNLHISFAPTHYVKIWRVHFVRMENWHQEVALSNNIVWLLMMLAEEINLFTDFGGLFQNPGLLAMFVQRWCSKPPIGWSYPLLYSLCSKEFCGVLIRHYLQIPGSRSTSPHHFIQRLNLLNDYFIVIHSRGSYSSHIWWTSRERPNYLEYAHTVVNTLLPAMPNRQPVVLVHTQTAPAPYKLLPRPWSLSEITCSSSSTNETPSFGPTLQILGCICDFQDSLDLFPFLVLSLYTPAKNPRLFVDPSMFLQSESSLIHLTLQVLLHAPHLYFVVMLSLHLLASLSSRTLFILSLVMCNIAFVKWPSFCPCVNCIFKYFAFFSKHDLMLKLSISDILLVYICAHSLS